MAVSLATRLTPYMGSGDVPRVVISGHFVLGTCADSSGSYLFVAPFLDMRCMVYPLSPTTKYTMSVAVSTPEDDGFSEVRHWDGLRAAASDWGPVNFDYPPTDAAGASYDGIFDPGAVSRDFPDLVRVFAAGTGSGDTYYKGNGTSADWNQLASYEAALQEIYPSIGESRPKGSVVITLTGRLAKLALEKIRASAVFRRPGDTYRRFMSNRFFGNYGVDGPGGYKYTGWFLDHVDVYDQQQLRGLITGADGKITWH